MMRPRTFRWRSLKPSTRSFSSLQETETRLQALKKNPTEYSAPERQELMNLRAHLSSKLKDQRVKDVLTQIDLNIAEIGRLTSQNVPPPQWDLYKKIAPEYSPLIQTLQSQYEQDVQKKVQLDVPEFPPLGNLDAKIDSTYKASTELLRTYQQIAKKQMSKIAQSIKDDQAYLNNALNVSIATELESRPELEAAIEEEISNHHWDEETSDVGTFATSNFDIERQVLVDIFGSSSPIVTHFKGDLKQALEAARK